MKTKLWIIQPNCLKLRTPVLMAIFVLFKFNVGISQPPTITNFSPTSGTIGTGVIITGTNFDPTPTNNTVKFNGIAAVVTASTSTSITTSVPAGVTSGTISVTVNGLTAMSSVVFNVSTFTGQLVPENNGLYGGGVYALTTSGSNVFAGTGNGVFLSTNNGTSWTAVNTGISQQTVDAIAINGSNIFAGTGTGYAGTGNGIFLSTDNGTSWTAVNTGLTSLDVNSILISGSNIFAGTVGGGVFLSTNNGASWAAMNTGLTNTNIRSLVINGNTIFAGTYGGVFLSSDNGTSWTAVSTGLTNSFGVLGVTSLAISGSNIFAGTNGGVFLSSNNGTSWTAVNTGLIITYGISSLTISGSNIFAGANGGGVYLSDNSGTSWTAVNTGLTNTSVQSLAVSGSNILAGTYGGIFLSSTNVTSWTAVNSGLTSPAVHSIVNNGTNLFAGTSSGVFLSINNGTSWTAVNNGLTNTDVRSLVVSGSTLFAGTLQGGIFLSTNNGTSWTVVSGSNGSTIGPINTLTVSGSNVLAGTQGGIFQFTNSGAGWISLGSFLLGAEVNSIAISGSNIFAGTLGGMYLSSNNGSTWTAINTGLSTPYIGPGSTLVISGSNIFVGTEGGGVFLSTNNGTSWSAVNTGLTNTNITSLALNGTDLFAGTFGGGVFLSTNSGANWWAVTSGSASTKIATLSVVGSNLLAGTWDAGIWSRPLSDFVLLPTIASFTPTSGVTGTTVTITGTNFDPTPANNTVKFNGIAATVTASTSTSITTSVPSGAATGYITVAVAGNTATSTGNFGVPLSAPVATAAIDLTTNTFNATWNASASATSYNLDVATSSDFSVFVTGYQNHSVGQNNVTSFVVNGLTPGTNYYYRVRATDDLGGSSPSSNVQQVLTLSTSGHVINYTLISYLNSTQVNAPSGVAFDASSNLYVSSGFLTSAVVKVFDKSGTYLRSIGSAGTGPGQFQGPTQLAVDNSGNVFVADGFNGTVQVFDNTGTYVRTIGGGTIISANELTLAPNGNVYVTDGGYTPTRIFVYKPDGTYVANFSKTGNFSAWGLAVDGSNNSYITEAYSKTIQIFNSNPSFVRSIGSGYIGYPHDVKVDANGNIYVADYSSGGMVQIFDNSGTYLYTLDGSTGNKVFKGVSAIAINSNGSVIAVADANNNLVQVFGIPDIAISQNTTTIAPGGTFDFGNVNMLSNSGDLVFNVQDPGTAPVVISVANSSLTGTNASDFTIDYSNINSGTATIRFTPSATGLRTAVLSVSNNVTGKNPYLINLQGTGVKSSQTITFNTLSASTFGDTPFALSATASSGLTVSYSSGNTSVATISGNTITIVGAGTSTITASQAGDANYNAANDVQQTLTVNKAAQVITFGAPAAKTFGDAAFDLTSTGGSSTQPVTYASSNSNVATISGATVTIVGAGTSTITASQAGDNNYNAAADVQQTLTVNKENQTIIFSALADVTIGDPPFTLGATSSSGLVITYSTPTSGKITIAGSQVTLTNAGMASIRADQIGDANFNAATTVIQIFCIKPAQPTITISGDNTATPTLTSSATSGNQWFQDGAAISGAIDVTLSITAAGIYSVQTTTVDGCASSVSANFPMIVTGDLPNTIDITIYPNPVEGYLEIVGLKDEVTSSQLYDMTGRANSILLEKNDKTYQANVQHLSPGIYLLRMKEGSELRQIKFVKK